MMRRQRIDTAGAARDHDRTAGKCSQRDRAAAELTLPRTHLTLRAVAHELCGRADDPAPRWLVEPPSVPPGRILPGQMQRHLEGASKGLADLIAATHQPLMKPRTVGEKLKLRRIELIWPPEIDDAEFLPELAGCKRLTRKLEDADGIGGVVVSHCSPRPPPPQLPWPCRRGALPGPLAGPVRWGRTVRAMSAARRQADGRHAAPQGLPRRDR